MKNQMIIFAIVMIVLCSSCNQVKLTNEEAKTLVVRTLGLPITYRHDIDKRPTMGSGFELGGLRNAGLITGSETLDSRRAIEIQITEMGQSSFIGENNDAYMFKTNDIDFDQITGISINKEEQTATIRFSIKAKNVTLAAYALAKTKAGFSGRNYLNYSLINPLNGELVFKKFDNGWQLLEQGKSSSVLLNQLLDSDVNSNRNDDYTKLISDKSDEIYAKKIKSSDNENKSNNSKYTVYGIIKSVDYPRNDSWYISIVTPTANKVMIFVNIRDSKWDNAHLENLKEGVKIGVIGEWEVWGDGTKGLNANKIDFL
ncbi:MAG: hypothetical protein NTZ69_18845 [Bacteroidia bacterium]|nr:hypothetical protein [Bacteroidia bacterium]